MTIQGSTTAFPIRGLLEFLHATGRTGRFVVHAQRHMGIVAVRQGRLVAAGIGDGVDLPALTTPGDLDVVGALLADLVDLPGGRFSFHPDGVDGPDGGFDLLQALAAADAMGDGVDGAIPADAPLTLVPEPAFAAVTVPVDQWEVLARLGDGATVASLAAELGLGRATVRRRLEGLVHLGLAEVAAVAAA